MVTDRHGWRGSEEAPITREVPGSKGGVTFKPQFEDEDDDEDEDDRTERRRVLTTDGTD
jgi:hypothetical protein